MYEVEGLAFDRESKRDEAQRAYARAAELNSSNFFVYLRLDNSSDSRQEAEYQRSRR